MKTNYTREELINICEKAIVHLDSWRDRDSSEAQRQVGDAWALLKSGCPYKVLTKGDLQTDEKTIWIEHTFTDFSGFEHGTPFNEIETLYLRTPKRLENVAGADW
ncbi:hypothetical protein KX928_00005 [Roseobacter sp. YSTF-M11]|uniref:Uncharacterized protein n=1 Tax=Roseobacter insulae TaxID=2859783 RepID=A0A9X1FQY5_9RHOB|nr:hypothetical protein [Roseobacter insulae]MBW4706161.1 hypothetical protein [Roseobacter insulae]